MAVKLKYGINLDNRIVTIDEVKKGIACNCVCPECKTKLIAKKGKVNVHHFAHKNGCVCIHAPETAIHKWAKEIVSENNQIVIDSNRIYEYNFARLESRVGQVIPDITATGPTESPLFIEIVVTNDVTQEKEKYLRQHLMRTLVIYLHNVPRDISRKKLEEEVLFNYSNRRIIEYAEEKEFPKLNFNWKAAAIVIGIVGFMLWD